MMTMTKFFACLGVLLLIGVGQAHAAILYAKKDRVKITADKSPTSRTIAMLSLGDPVEVIQQSGRRYRVKLPDGKTGWVFKFKLSENKPTRRSGGSGLAGLTGQGTVVAQEARAGGSIRGLKESTKQYAERKRIDPAHRQAVENMEQFSLSPDELLAFQREGGIGEYAGGGQ
ncbi:MAG: hypothetical protein D6690_03320 [Nitrospirae bacterium]|nr:MAG: hypothetical protein D6690_03320 [Nitrospirota bacterium]